MERTFVQLHSFSDFLDDKEKKEVTAFLQELELAILANPEIGDVIRGSGGVRKFRFGDEGKGKSGGFRILYLDLEFYGKTYLLLAYRKSKSENISKEELKHIKNSVDRIKDAERNNYEKIKSSKKSR